MTPGPFEAAIRRAAAFITAAFVVEDEPCLFRWFIEQSPSRDFRATSGEPTHYLLEFSLQTVPSVLRQSKEVLSEGVGTPYLVVLAMRWLPLDWVARPNSIH